MPEHIEERERSTAGFGLMQVDRQLWLARREPRLDARLRMFCFSYAGGGASAYRLWPAGLPNVDVCAVQLPGREDRLRERPLSSIAEIVEALTPVMLPHLDRPYALFGHSMGGLLAMEIAYAIIEAGGPPLQWLFVSGRRPAHVADSSSALRHLPDGEFAAELNRRYGGIPAEILADEELMALLLPAIRADITALETYESKSRAPLPCNVLALGGTEDFTVGSEHLAEWKQVTTGSFALRMFPGNHFYLNPRRADVLAELRRVLGPSLTDSVRVGGAAIEATV